jgi:hypothetical protein
MTTLGSEHWPRPPEGRILTFLLALYAFHLWIPDRNYRQLPR